MVSFAFTLGTFIKVVSENFATLTEAQHEVHTYRLPLTRALAAFRLISLVILPIYGKNYWKSELV